MVGLKTEEMPACGPYLSGPMRTHVSGVVATSMGNMDYSGKCSSDAKLSRDDLRKAFEDNKHLMLDPICKRLIDEYSSAAFRDEMGLVDKCYDAGSRLDPVPVAARALVDFELKKSCLRAYAFGKYEVMKGYRPKAPRP